MKTTIFDTKFAELYSLRAMATNAAKWLATNSGSFDTNQHAYQNTVNINPITTTLISEIYSSCKAHGLLASIFYISTLNNRKLNVPEVLTVPDITIYGRQVQNARGELTKCWLNISPMLQASSRTGYGNLKVVAGNELMSQIVRAVLCMSYDNNEEWLPTNVKALLATFYGKYIVSCIDRNIDITDEYIAEIAFAYYYAARLSKADSKGVPSLMHKIRGSFVGSGSSYDDILAALVEVGPCKSITLDQVISVISKFSSGKIAGGQLSSDLIYRSQATSAYNSNSAMTAVDYPPYMLHLMLVTLSGSKHMAIDRVIKTKFKNRYVASQLVSLTKYRRLYEKII